MSLLAELGWAAKVLAGGQSLVPMLNLRILRPSSLIDLKRLTLNEISDTDGVLRIGSTVRQHRLIEEGIVRGRLPILADAASYIAHPAIRNRGTVGGSIAHADPAAELTLMSVLLDAQMVIRSTTETRRVAAEDFLLGTFSTALSETEILEAVEFPVSEELSTYGFNEIAQREGDFALAAAAVTVGSGPGGISTVRVAVAGGSEVPIRLPDVERLILEATNTEALAKDAREIAMESVEPMDDIHATSAHRRNLVGEMLARSVTQALGGTI